MQLFRHIKWFDFFIGILILFFIIYISPIYKIGDFDFLSFFNNQDGKISLLRSLLFTIISTAFTIIISLRFAISLNKIKLHSKSIYFFSLLFLPVVLGNVSIAFLGKILLSESVIVQESMWLKFLSLGFIQFWQYGTLFTYLFWLNLQKIPIDTSAYAETAKLSFKEKARDILLPASKDLTGLLLILSFIFSFYENAKGVLIFKSSPGTNTEMIIQWLNRMHQSNSLISADFASGRTISYGIVVLIISIIILAIFFYAQTKSYYKLNGLFAAFSIKSRFQKYIWLLIIIFIVLPILYVLIQSSSILKIDFLYLGNPILYSLIASFISLICAAFIAIVLRFKWRNTLVGLNNKSMPIFVSLFLLQLTPPIIIYLLGFQWIKNIDFINDSTMGILWVIGHTILITPLLVGFILIFHFNTKEEELIYLESHKIKFFRVIKDCFFTRYKLEYILSYLLCFSFIWNETIINNLLSDYIPSFVSDMKMSIEGRSANSSRAMGYLIISLIIATLIILLWNYILKRNNKIDDELA